MNSTLSIVAIAESLSPRTVVRGGALLLASAPLLSVAADADWLRCKEQQDDAQRLVCYDRVAASMSPEASRARFGLPASAPSPEPEVVDATLADAIDGWQAGSRIRLENGQVWQIVDDSSGFLRSGTRNVRIRRGALGAYYMEFEGSNRSPKVRRRQ